MIDVRERDPTSGAAVNQHKLTYVGWDNHHDRWVNPQEVRRKREREREGEREGERERGVREREGERERGRRESAQRL